MNPFQRARDKALKVREALFPGGAENPIPAKDLVGAIEGGLGLAVESIAPTFPDLGRGTAVLQRDQMFIYVSNVIPPWGDVFCGLVAHELGHWYLDAEQDKTKVVSLSEIFLGNESSAVMKVEAYGARERKELQANVFAREFLLPRGLAKRLYLNGSSSKEVAQELGVPIDFVRQQTLDALLLPDTDNLAGYLHPPSPDQLAAARAEERAANVVAGPGTGKTTTLVHRVKYLVEDKKVDPSRILVLTFTNKAAAEIVDRLRSSGIAGAADIWAGTFHSFGLEFLRKYHHKFDLDADVKVADDLSSISMLVAALPHLQLHYYLRVEDPYDWLAPVVEGVKRLKEELVTPEEYREFVSDNPSEDADVQRRREDVVTLFEAYEAILAQNKTIDFVDLIGKPARSLKRDRESYAEMADRFDHILVDEYQDVTQAMVEFIRQIAKNSKSIWVVGDIRQAIHHWRGASLKSLLRFDAEFKTHAGGARIQRYPLDTNRRSSHEILELIQEIGKQHKLESNFPLDPMVSSVGNLGVLPQVVTCTRKDEIAGAVASKILSLRQSGVDFGNQAVLCRRALDVQVLADSLGSRGIPVIYVGDLSQRSEIKRLICLMQLLVERQPNALLGLLEVPGLAMPSVDIRRLLAAASSDVSYQRGRWLMSPPSGLTAAGLDVVAKFSALLAAQHRGVSPWAFLCDVILDKKFGLPNSSDNSVSAWLERIAIWQFVSATRNGGGEGSRLRLSRFLIEHRLRQRVGGSYVDRELPPEAGSLNGVRLLTVHGSKGLEFEAVHVAYADSGSYGSQKGTWNPAENVLDIVPPEALGSSREEYEVEEAVERNNLFYVAVSRAKRHLIIYQDNQFGDHTLAPQLQHFPRKYTSVSYEEPRVRLEVRENPKEFSHAGVVKFEKFDTYSKCALQFWYSNIVGLRSEADIDNSLRARKATMIALRNLASGVAGVPESFLVAAWEDRKLPSSSDDPSLWRDANYAFSLGVKRIRFLQEGGGQFSEPTAVVGGVEVQMPWGFIRREPHSTEFSMMRFSRRRVDDIITLLRPMVIGLNISGTKSMSLSYVLSEKVDVVPGVKRIDQTKSFKAAVKMLSGDNGPTRGRFCGRCSFSSICPSAPRLLGID
ncbi:MAG: UvrD-helicase domain-containing protein [Pseudomonadota bacterium]